nr:Rieske (2Fe-2S) protein [Nocardioides sp. MAH-18]
MSRRTLAGAAVAGVGASGLAACSGDSDPGAEPSRTPSVEPPSTPEPTAEPSATAAPSEPSEPPGLVDLADLPVGGGRVVAAEEVVVTQPERGRIMCFSAVCTHRGCVVSDVEDGTINCGCHGSRFSVADGTVVSGPASTALPTVEITVRDGVVRLA